MFRKKHMLQSLDFRVEELEYQVGMLHENFLAGGKSEKRRNYPNVPISMINIHWLYAEIERLYMEEDIEWSEDMVEGFRKGIGMVQDFLDWCLIEREDD